MAGGAGGEMANLAAQGCCMARLAVQNHSWPFWRASTTIVSSKTLLILDSTASKDLKNVVFV
jgi:hypothetical protein